MRSILFFVVAAVGLLLPRPSSAQDPPRFGLVFAFPAEIGVAIKATDRITIRPGFDMSKSSTETTQTITLPIPGTTSTTTTATGDAWTVSGEVAALFYLSAPDAFRTYLAPRVAYGHSSTTVPFLTANTSSEPAAFTTTTSTYDVSGTFGAQYTLGRRFVVFGEAGPRYRRSKNQPSTGFFQSQSTSRSIGIQSGIGVIVYFSSEG
jgi:hypothetical protein